MRLLEGDDDGEFRLTQDLVGDHIPTYAILSHTWGPDTEEVTFKDLVGGTGKDKVGYDKIRFCSEQARYDGLKYFWVDTCCIDKSNNNELSEAINSMFRWYHDAARCYVYLSNISITGHEQDSKQCELLWDSAFRASRWFTRGWTLQELLAPASVTFFTRNGRRLGDKISLEQKIHEITGIAIPALRGRPLSQFAIGERLKWAEQRQTTRKEDWAYCLMGIFGVFMPLIYGEGREHAIHRLKKEIGEPLTLEDASEYQGETLMHQALSGYIESKQATRSTFTVKRLDALEQKVDGIVAHTSTLPSRGQHKRSIWKDDFNHGFHLDKVPLINCFVGRQEYITDMELCLLSDPELSRRKTYVICGLGGMGKTQLAVEFARRHKTTFSSIFFIDGSSKEALLQSFLQVFRRVAVSDIDDAKSHSERDGVTNLTPDGITAKTLEWFSLEGNETWLLIYDNVDLEPTDPGGFELDAFFPAKDFGFIIVTTRLASLPVAATVKHLGQLDAIQSIELLTRTSTAGNAMKAVTNLGSRPGAQATAKLKLVEDLGGLPLAISQAGKLMKSLGVDVEEYLELYKHSKRKVIGMLLPEALPNDPERASIRTTWTTSVNILKQRMSNEHDTGPHRCAYQLLHLFAYFDPVDLDYELLKNARLVNKAPAWISKVFESKLDFYSTAKILLDLSLIDKTNNSGIYSMHRVVFDWLCTYEAYEIDAELLNTAAAAIAWACPVSYVPLQWAESQQRLILHANVLGQRLPGCGPLVRPFWYDQASKADLELAADLWECDIDTLRHSQVYQPIGDIARLLSSGGKPQEALVLIEDSIAHTIDYRPEQDMAYYALLYEKALILLDLSLAPDANTALIEALDGFRRLQNPYWIVCAQILQGIQDPEAETSIRWYQDALATARASRLCVFYCPMWLAFGNIDRTLQWHLYDPQRRRVHLESVKEEAERRGYDLHNAQEALRSLASTYVELGVNDAAETLYLKLLEWQVRRYGRDAIEVIPRVQDLAWFFFNQGRAESIEYDAQCLRLVELHYGPVSHDTGTAHCFLGESYERHGQPAKAREHFERAWGINQLTKGLAMEKVVLSGLVRVCGALEDKEGMEKYQALQHVSSGKKRGLQYDTKVYGGSVPGVSSTFDAVL